MFRKQGLITKIKDNYCIVVTREGIYKRIPLPAGGVRPGMEVSFRDFALYPFFKPVMLAASILILLIGLTLFRQVAVPPAAAYVSLDINPSLELAVNKDMQVIDVGYFNDDGLNLVMENTLEGKNLYEALNIIIKSAIEQKYIKTGQKNLMVSTVTATSTDMTGPDPARLQQELESAIAAGGFTGEVRVYQVAAEMRKIAEKSGLSPGKFIIYEQVKAKGGKVTVKEIKQNSIRELVDIYKIKLLPNHKKIIIQEVDNNGRPRVLIEENGKTFPAGAPGKNNDSRDDEDRDEDKDEADHDRSKKDNDADEDQDQDKNEKPDRPRIKKDERVNVKIDEKNEDKDDNPKAKDDDSKNEVDEEEDEEEDDPEDAEERPSSGNDKNPDDGRKDRDGDRDD